MSDDENELEKLRLAALQTLKASADVKHRLQHKSMPYNHSPPTWRKFSGQGRGAPRNGQFNGRKTVNTNLISILTLESQANHDSAHPLNDEKQVRLRLDLPQNRYSKTNEIVDSDSKKESSKFSRYDDNSDSDSENSETSDSEDKLVRSSSLEALVQELEYEISGEKPDRTPVNRKPRFKKSKVTILDLNSSGNANDVQSNENTVTDGTDEKLDDALNLFVDCAEDKIEDEPQAPAPPVEPKKPEVQQEMKPRGKNSLKTENKPARKSLLPKPRGYNPRPDHKLPPVNPGIPHQYPPPVYVPILPLPLPYPDYPPVEQRYYNKGHNSHAPLVMRPLSPLRLNHDSRSAPTMAPLSPRSAAFVLQNREIIEKRKRSPRHSYSRSPSPRLRRSKSPRRRSASPKRSSPPKRSKRKSRSPIDRSPKRDIRDRLTLNNNKRVERERPSENSDAPTKNRRDIPAKPQDKVNNKDEKPDPVLEARRRKFEQQNTVKEGIIRLKPADEEPNKNREKNEEEIAHTPDPHVDSSENNEENTPDVDMLETHIDDLFSDEESEDENEGRFKSSSQTKANAPVLKFTSLNKLTDIQNKSLEDASSRNRLGRSRNRRNTKLRRNDRDKERFREREVRLTNSIPNNVRKERVEKKGEKKEVRHDEDPVRQNRETDRKEERKPSIKARLTIKKNDKDDKNDRSDKKREEEKKPEREVTLKDVKVAKANSTTTQVVTEVKVNRIKERPISTRKVAIAVEVKENKDYKPKEDVTVIDDDDEQDVLKKTEAGDLRAQLSRKRAERQIHKSIVSVEHVQSRLLHNALGAVFQKSTKTKRPETAPKDKVPIYQRLGLNDELGIKKTKRKRNSGDQVLCFAYDIYLVNILIPMTRFPLPKTPTQYLAVLAFLAIVLTTLMPRLIKSLCVRLDTSVVQYFAFGRNSLRSL